MGISSPEVCDIESHEDDLTACYSASQVLRFCHVLGIRPGELFSVDNAEPEISAAELVRLIHEQCALRGVTLEQFEDAVGWELSRCIEPPGRLLEDLTIDGLQWLCREVGISWHRVIAAL